MKYIFQFARITAFCLAGEVLAAVLPLPIPASVYGLLLLAAALSALTGVLTRPRRSNSACSSSIRCGRPGCF